MGTKYGSGQDVPDVKIESTKPRPSYDPLAMLKNRTTENDEDKSRADDDNDQPLGKHDPGQAQDGLVTFHTDEEPGARVARQSRVYHSSSEEEEVEEKVRGKKEMQNEEGKGTSKGREKKVRKKANEKKERIKKAYLETEEMYNEGDKMTKSFVEGNIKAEKEKVEVKRSIPEVKVEKAVKAAPPAR